MNETVEFLLRSTLIGAGATLVIDVWAALLRRFGVPSLNFAVLGRWIAHIPRGHWRHESIARAAPMRGELLMGWCAHYAIGISFAALLLACFGLEWGRVKSLITHTIFGVGLFLAARATASLVP